MVGVWMLMCLVYGMVRSEDLKDTVRSVVVNTNRYIAENNIDHISLPDFTDSQSMHELLLKNIKMGNFSSAELKEVAFVNRTEIGGSSLYRYDIVLGLKPAAISYDFQLTIEGMFPMSGKAVIAAQNNSYEVKGTLLMKEDGTCQAVLESIEFRELKNFVVNLRPRSVSYMSSFKKNFLDTMAPHLVPRINKVFEELIQHPKFQAIFSKIVCSNIKK